MSTTKIRVIPLPIRTQGPMPRRIVEDRGELVVLHPEGALYNPVYFDLVPGDGRFRGAHFHASKTERCYLIAGSCRLSYADLDSGEKGCIEASHGDLITIEPRCAHKMEAVEFCRALEFTSDAVDHFADTMPYDGF